MLNVISKRLMRIRENNLPFGGLSALLIADFSQLHCIQDHVLTKDPSTCFDSFAREGIFIYQSANLKLTLKESVRQVNDKRFEQLLNNVRNKKVTADDIKLLTERQLKNLTQEERNSFESVIHVYTTNQRVLEFNKNFILKQGKPVRLIKPFMTPLCVKCLNDYKSFYAGMNEKILITRNLAYSLKVCNGTSGIIQDVVYDDGKKLPSFIVVRIKDFIGIPLENTRDHVPIPLITEKIWCGHNQKYLTVSHFPIANNHATSYHRIQGQTLPKIVVCTDGMFRFDSRFYVGLSRTSRLSDIAIEGDQSIDSILSYKSK